MKIELKREVGEKDKISQLLDEFYIKNGKKEGEAYQTVSEADWKLGRALQRLAENQDKLVATVESLALVVNNLIDLVEPTPLPPLISPLKREWKDKRRGWKGVK